MHQVVFATGAVYCTSQQYNDRHQSSSCVPVAQAAAAAATAASSEQAQKYSFVQVHYAAAIQIE